MTCYLIHFDRPFQHARHYLGFVESLDLLDERLVRHYRGNGANLMKHVQRAGITWRLVRVWPDADRNQERRLKKQGGHAAKCPICCGRAPAGFSLNITELEQAA